MYVLYMCQRITHERCKKRCVNQVLKVKNMPDDSLEAW